MLGKRDFNRMSQREIAIQIAVVLLIAAIAVGAYFSANINLFEMGITSDFNFLDRDTS